MRAVRNIGLTMAMGIALCASGAWANEASLESSGTATDTSGAVTTTIAMWANVAFDTTGAGNTMNLKVVGNPGSINDAATSDDAMAGTIKCNTGVDAKLTAGTLKLRSTRAGGGSGTGGAADDTVAPGGGALSVDGTTAPAFRWDVLYTPGAASQLQGSTPTSNSFGITDYATQVMPGDGATVKAATATPTLKYLPGENTFSLKGFLQTGSRYANTVVWPQPATGYNSTTLTMTVSATSGWTPGT